MMQNRKRALSTLFGVLTFIAISLIFFLPVSAQYAQVIVFAPSDYGTTTPSGVQNYGLSQQVPITAAPKLGYSFSSWSANPSSSVVFANPNSASTVATIVGSATITANFVPNTYIITLYPGTGGNISKNPNQVTYNYSTAVQLSATPLAGYSFVSWGGDLSGSTNPTSITMDTNKTITANFVANSYVLTVNAGTGGTVSKNPDPISYNYGVSVQLTANPNVGYSFSGWSGAASGSTNPVTVIMDANKTLTASFAVKNYTLDVSATAGGSVLKSPNLATYSHGSIIQLTATPNAGYNFVGWAGSASGSNNPLSVTMDANKVITASFTPKVYVLNVNADPATGSVTKSPDQSTYNHGSSVQLLATPNSGYTFVSWSGSVSGTTNPITITMDGDKAVTANFALKSYTLNVNVGQGGTVTRNPNNAKYNYGSSVQLTANPNPGYSFVSWTGDVSSSNSILSITMDSDKSVTATFVLNSYTLNVNSNSGGSVTKSPNQASYSQGTNVQLIATPLAGYSFTGWTGSITSSANPVTITMDANKAVTATFTPNSYSLSITSSAGGSVTKSPNSQSYSYGTVVQLSAVPSPGYAFAGWNGAVTGSANPITITMNSNKVITAEFTQNLYQVTFTGSNGGIVNPTGTQTIPENSMIPLSATANQGYTFVSWNVDPPQSAIIDNSNSASTTATIKGPATITATFKVAPPDATATPTSKPSPTLQPSSSVKQTTSPSLSPSPTQVPETTNMTAKIIPAALNDGSTINLSIIGNLNSSTISNVSLISDQSSKKTTLDLTLLNENEHYSFCNITIPKSQVTYGEIPIVYINNQVVSDYNYNQDANNYYVWYSAYTNTYELSIVFSSPSNMQFFAGIAICVISVFLVLVIVMPSIRVKKKEL